MSDLGLASILPPAAIVALLAVNLSFALCLRRSDVRSVVLLMHVLVLMLMVYGVTNLVEDEPRFGSVYRHVGIIDHLVRSQEIERTIDAYFDWPGFFGLGALLVDAGDLANALPFAEWATVVVNLMYLGPLLLIFRGLGAERRTAWLAVWLFTLTNWIGQDYFSPQSFAYFLYLSIIALVLLHFGPSDAARERLARFPRFGVAATVPLPHAPPRPGDRRCCDPRGHGRPAQRGGRAEPPAHPVRALPRRRCARRDASLQPARRCRSSSAS